MERLEAALEKARESRRKVQSAQVAEAEEAKPAVAKKSVSQSWLAVKEFHVSGRAAGRNRISTLAQGKEATAYDLLRSRIRRVMDEHGWTSVAITSPNSACGKTTVTTNLAFSLARQPELKVMVFDMDFRRPSLAKVLSQRPAHSFHEVLLGKVKPEEQFIRFGDNLIFATNTTPAKRASELLDSSVTHNALKAIRAEYQPDIVIFDMPPMLATDDNVAFLPHVDCGVLINAADSTTIAQLDASEKEMAELTNVLGVVLNKCRFPGPTANYDQDYY